MTQKSQFIAVCGAPNVGKSTLINALVGTKVTIVSPRPQTTRITIRGITVEDNTQMVFIDTPGIFTPKGNRQKEMVNHAWSGIEESEQILLLVDAKRGFDHRTEKIVQRMVQSGKRAICVINKVDLVDKASLLPIAETLAEYEIFDEIFMVSAFKDIYLAELKKHLIENAPEQPWPYDEDQISDMNDRLFAAEITREKAFLLLREELPYGVDVETEEFKEDDERITIHQLLQTGEENHKKIIIGKQASMVKEIGTKARAEMIRLFGKKVELKLHVKVNKKLAGN